MGYHTLRSFVISLTIAIAISKTSVSGFAIGRSHNDVDTDLETAESTQLEVKYDLKGLSDLQARINSKSPINLSKNITELVPLSSLDNKHLPDITKIEGSELKNAPESPKRESNSYTTAVPSTSQITTIDPEISQNRFNKSYFSIGVVSHNIPIKDFSNENHEPNVILESATQSTENLNGSEIKKIPINENLKREVNLTTKQDLKEINKTEDKQQINNSSSQDSYAARKEITRSISEGFTSDYDGLIPLKENDQIVYETTTEKENSVTRIDEFIVTTTLFSELVTDVTKIMLDTVATEFDVTTENMITDATTTTDSNLYVPTIPSWKKNYTNIARKRTTTEVSNSTTTASDKDMVRAETAQTRISLDKVFTNTPIPSLEKLRMELINAQESTTMGLEATTVMITNTNSSAGNETKSLRPVVTKNESESTILEIVSKRAGFKDNMETTSLKPQEATTPELSPKVATNNTELMFSSMYETGDVEPVRQNVTAEESQSQLADDAMKEELLREETLNDNEEYARQHDARLFVSQLKSPTDRKTVTNDDGKIVNEYVTEDMLSVKPISIDNKKKALYAVSQNYKPLKKIDVQPAKPFVRDPDDNTWRNESISSLGIVFKAKNASKSFTEVLKNKTESELNNLLEKGNKENVPDLRVRLEKIAEVRKKKKKINKFGDTVYSDYEESGENVDLFKDYISLPMKPSEETVLTSTTSSPSVPSTTELDLTVNAISREIIDIFKTEGTTPLTTEKPKNVYNLAEYDEGTDEYDADYINLSRIDLKKFTQQFKPRDTPATRSPDLLHTTPMRGFMPERKATLQYFPPTQKATPKMMLNDYDTEFNRKVNLYTFREPTTKVLPALYGTVSPVQTELYEERNKITAKPAKTPPQQLPMYKTDNLNNDLYITNPPQLKEPRNEFVNEGDFNRASYVIKHYRDFINEAVKDDDDDRGPEYPYTESPLQGVTINELSRMTTPKNPTVDDEYDYDVKFRKDVINRFVDNFNQNSERFKVDFPILYNNSVVHRQTPNGGKVVASSSAFMKRMYEIGRPRTNFLKPCDPNCDNMTVELSPAYELHYYVPDQEEKEEVEPRPISLPYRYRL